MHIVSPTQSYGNVILCEPAEVYHAKSRENLSSHQLGDFRRCPALYHKKKLGLVSDEDRPAYVIGRGLHTLVLEGRDKFEAEYAVGGPINPKTGELFGATTKAYAEWAAAQGKPVLTLQQFDLIESMADGVRANQIAVDLLSEGVAEGVIRTEYRGMPAQIRMDWFDPFRSLVDLKSCDDLTWFEADARRYSYVHQWLEANKGNRRLNWNYIAQLARDMKAGQFVCTHQGIAFDTQGRLIDGQHRLWAVLEAETPVRMRVFFNESPDTLLHIDGNSPRQAADRMTMAKSLGTVRSNELATLRAMVGGIGMITRRRTVHEEIALFEQHRDAVRFAHEHLPMTRPAGIANAMIRAVIARAWYCVTSPSSLQRFCEVLRTGASAHDGEHVIVLLRNHLLDLRKEATTIWGRQRQYGLVSRALLAYLRHESLTVLRAATAELFLLPEDVPAEDVA